MIAGEVRFYVVGGTLRLDAPSYIERRADQDLCGGLKAGEFCYVLTARQMGKSSLMVHAAQRLRREGAAVAILDLTAIGQNLSPAQWYGGLLERLGQQIDPTGSLEELLEDFWFDQEHLGSLQRWMTALRQIVLPRVAGRLVIFVDEIDVVRSLPFSTDEFFAGIRECYNRRAEDGEYARLTFCLLGVASPSDLIRDTRLTPFNIGRRIELTDFGEAEARPLAQGLKRKEPVGVRLLDRVLYWTGGHPYLTQRLCQAVATATTVTDRAGVDRLCAELFFAPRAQERDDNLLFVRELLLHGEVGPAGLLDFYAQVRRGQRVPDDETNPLVSRLRLSGVVRWVAGYLKVRNRIYARVFDQKWVTAHMPDAELRRQRAAYQRGLWRAVAVSGVILMAMGGLVLAAMTQAHRADQQRQAAQEGQRALRRTLYAADMSLADQAWEAGNLGRARELLEAHRPERVGEELRGFEWRYLWGLTRGDDRFAFLGHTNSVLSVAFSSNGRLLASGSFDRTVRLWDVVRQRPAGKLQLTEGLRSLAISPDGELLAAGLGDGTLMLWDVAGRRLVATRKPHTQPIHAVSFSPDGRLLATTSGDGTLKLWSMPACRVVAGFRHRDAGIIGLNSGAFAPSGRFVAVGATDGSITFWDVATRRVQTTFQGFAGVFSAMALSPDGKSLAAGSDEGVLRLWDLAAPDRPRLAADVPAHAGVIFGLAFSPDGTRLATASFDNLVKLWACTPVRDRRTAERAGATLPALRLMDTLRGHAAPAVSVAFSPDGRLLATGGGDYSVRLWDTHRKRQTDILKGPDLLVPSVALSADGRLLAAASERGAVRIWDLAAGGPPRSGSRPPEERRTFRAHRAGVNSLAFSPDGRVLATASEDRTVKLWDVATQREVGTLRGHRGSVYAVAFSPGRETLATGSEDRTIKLWGITNKRVWLTLKAHEDGVQALAFSPDGGLLASGGGGDDDTSVRLWRLAMRRGAPTLRSVAVHAGHRRGVTCIAFSPDGRFLASGSSDYTIRLWDAAGKAAPVVLRGHQSIVQAVAFSADGKTLASGSVDATVKLWDLTTRREVATLKGHRSVVTSVAFSPDGNSLVSGSNDGTVRLWRATSLAETDAPAGTRPPRRRHAMNRRAPAPKG